MKLKAKYLRHPIRTASVAKNLLATHIDMLKFARLGERRYGKDPRYDLQFVTDGYAPHTDNSDDTALLDRICTAYNTAVERQKLASEAYKADTWWEQARRSNLAPVTRALVTHDTVALQSMCRSFFRDVCSSGLSVRPIDVSKPTLAGRFTDIRRRFVLGDALSRLDYWMARTGGRFKAHDLRGPLIGNPFGLLMDDTLIRTGAEYEHYYANKICSLLSAEAGVVAEIGGGFGGMACYLLQDAIKITYMDYDVPENIALASYYLMKAFPELSFLLCGEDRDGSEITRRFDAVLMPLCELPKILSQSVDFIFSSHTLSEISEADRVEYLDQITRITRGHFWYIGDDVAGRSMYELIKNSYPSLVLAEKYRSEWNKDRISQAHEIELLYRRQLIH